MSNQEERYKMIWDEKTQSYRGETSGGLIIEVAADEWAESKNDGIQAYIDNQFPVDHDGQEFEGSVQEFSEQYPSLYERYENQVLADLNSPEMWAGSRA